MTDVADPITISVPRKTLSAIARLTEELNDRMHALLERNTDGELNSTEKAELETLVHMAHFGQIVSMALVAPSKP